MIAPTSTLNGEAARRLGIDLMAGKRNRQSLLNARKAIQAKITKIFEPREFEPVHDPELMIYAGGFFDDHDKALQYLDVHTSFLLDQLDPPRCFGVRG